MSTILEERKKIEISSSENSFVGSIFYSLCGSDDEGSVVSGSCTCCMNHNLSNGFIELLKNSDFCDEKSSLVEEIGSVNSKFRSSNKVTNSHLPYPSENECSPRVTFTPIRKMLNPFTKSKSLTRNMACQKSLLNDFQNTEKKGGEIKYSGLACSPVHFHGNLNLKSKLGHPYFEFKVNSSEDVFVAKTWRVGNAFKFNWVYTFHSLDNNRKKNNEDILISQHCDNKDSSSMVAQMLVSYSLSSELENEIFGNNMVTEFVLYDFTHSRKTMNASSLESAAIVLRIPFHKRKSLKCKKAYCKPSDMSSASDQVKVVLPIGNHGLPSDESRGPSSLLDRWKHGGGCDCGGWDMACPLILLNNPGIKFDEDCPLVKKYQPLELFSQPQGTKENTLPTFGMTLVEEGQYAVDFHAKLSPLQAFSICVAILHGTSSFARYDGK